MGKKTCFEGAATLARPISLPISLQNCSPQSLQALLKKYYTCLLFRIVCQVSQKMKHEHQRFQEIITALSDEKELTKVLELYGMKTGSQEMEVVEIEEITPGGE